jgi:DNA-binding transcriptional LysR family regulator
MHSQGQARYFYDLVVRLIPIREGNVVNSVSQILTMLWLVAGGRGIALVPASAAGLGIAGVSFVPVHGLPAKPVELHLLWHQETRNPALGSVLNALHRAQF